MYGESEGSTLQEYKDYLDKKMDAERFAVGLGDAAGALQIAEGFSSARYLLLHNKRFYQLYKLKGNPKLATKDSLGDCPLKNKDADIFLLLNTAENITLNYGEVDMKQITKGNEGYYSRVMRLDRITKKED